MANKLNWKVTKGPDGKFVRRVPAGNIIPELRNMQYIDVEWTHEDGFPEDTVTVPVTHPPDIKFETRKIGVRKVILDQLDITANTTDATIMVMLDEKRTVLAKALNISE